MSEQKGTIKGVGWAFLVIVLTLTVLPIGITIVTLGVDDYASNCKQAIHMPCFGLVD
jgi:hypothetical protein